MNSSISDKKSISANFEEIRIGEIRLFAQIRSNFNISQLRFDVKSICSK